jgi:hypothetical protein
VRTPQTWFRDGWDGLSAEGFTADGRLLLSNLRAAPTTFTLTAAAPAWEIQAVDGTSRLTAAHQLTLNPCELALAKELV